MSSLADDESGSGGPVNQPLAKNFVSQGSYSKRETLSNGQAIMFIAIPRINLYVISDIDNFGPHWISVEFAKNIYSTNYLLGCDSETFLPIARFFAQKIIEKTYGTVSPIELSMISKKLTINISLKKVDRHLLNEIADLI